MDLTRIIGIAIGAVLGAYIGLTGYAHYKDNVRDRVHGYLNDANITSYSTERKSEKVTAVRKSGPIELDIVRKDGRIIKLEDYPERTFVTGALKFRGLDYITINGKRMGVWDLSEDVVKPYEKEMDEKLKALEGELKEFADTQKSIKKAKEKQNRERREGLLKKERSSL